MDRILTLDICSVAILLCLLYSLYHRQIMRGTTNRVFFRMICWILVTSVFDILRFVAGKVLPANGFTVFLVYLFNYVYLITRNLTLPVYSLFVFSMCGLWHHFKTSRPFHLTWTISPFLVTSTFVVDLFIHKLFTVNPEDLSYSRGPMMYALYVFAFIGLIYSMVTLILFRRRLYLIKFHTLLVIFPIAIIGIIIQMMHPTFLIEMFTTTFPMMIISFVVQKPEEIINLDTGSLNYYACEDELKRNFLAKIHMNLVFISINNFEFIKNKVSNDVLQNFLRDNIKLLYNCFGTDECDVYYLDNGTFCVLSTRTKDDKFLYEAEHLCYIITKEDFSKYVDFGIDYKVCYAKCPADLKDVSAVLTFSRRIDSLIPTNNQLVYLSKEINTKNFQMINHLDDIINKAIQQKSFKMNYQPIYNIEKHRYTSAEALIRLIDDEYGFVPPNLFIPAAEKSGAIHQIGDFVLEDVCRFIRESQLQKYGIEYIEINLSVAQCIEKELSSKIENILRKNQLSPKFINLEITETAAEYDHSLMDKNINNLWQKGLDFSLDDFGTGYSNVKRVMDLPLNIIKLDKSFADEYENNEMQIVIESTISMFKKIEKKILIEGVETEDCKDYFTKVGCDYIQGYYYSKPRPEEDFVAFIKDANGEVEITDYE